MSEQWDEVLDEYEELKLRKKPSGLGPRPPPVRTKEERVAQYRNDRRPPKPRNMWEGRVSVNKERFSVNHPHYIGFLWTPEGYHRVAGYIQLHDIRRTRERLGNKSLLLYLDHIWTLDECNNYWGQKDKC